MEFSKLNEIHQQLCQLSQSEVAPIVFIDGIGDSNQTYYNLNKLVVLIYENENLMVENIAFDKHGKKYLGYIQR